jgi:hypothetical protein
MRLNETVVERLSDKGKIELARILHEFELQLDVLSGRLDLKTHIARVNLKLAEQERLGGRGPRWDWGGLRVVAPLIFPQNKKGTPKRLPGT